MYYRLSVELKGLVVMVMNGHCICIKWYSPKLDVQRFCHECNKWFHIKCLTDPQPSEGETVSLPKKIASMPVVCGALGKVNDEWRITGSGRKIQRVKFWKEVGIFPEDWTKELIPSSPWQVITNDTSKEAYIYLAIVLNVTASKWKGHK
ncbi:hypothetical protein M413DRAFT_13130 [Hebeloma cylindrosporum]|uniref:Uncharacterized protein n=1 Tax=Hebeloma cylindrosporum TaxID=76867 RepID=A0A0C3BMP1_HEBCY|nr:hypothetical protein M413DRAFT_13130 [Hebeloma cylindrosporum h7]